MSKCIYKEIANKLNKEEVEEYYKTHLPKDVCKKFGFDQLYFYRIFDYLGIERRSASENTSIQFLYYDNTDRNKKVGESNKGREVSEETKIKISESNKKNIGNRKSNVTSFKKGQEPWNKGKKGVQSWTSEQKDKYYKSLKESGWFSKITKPEIEVQNILNEKFGKDDVIYQYRDERYPYACDFYVKSKDLFIEVNFWWHHGNHPYDPDSLDDIEKVSEWEEKSKLNPQYKNAIYTWTIRDKQKIDQAKKNKLNYILLYTKNDIAWLYSNI